MKSLCVVLQFGEGFFSIKLTYMCAAERELWWLEAESRAKPCCWLQTHLFRLLLTHSKTTLSSETVSMALIYTFRPSVAHFVKCCSVNNILKLWKLFRSLTQAQLCRSDVFVAVKLH